MLPVSMTVEACTAACKEVCFILFHLPALNWERSISYDITDAIYQATITILTYSVFFMQWRKRVISHTQKKESKPMLFR